jgi:hypothetical protein
MKSEDFQSGRRGLKIFCFGVAALTIVCALSICAVTVVAQSGRRAPKSAPVPAATPQSTPSPTKPSEKEKPARTLIIGVDANDTFRIPSYFYDTVLQSCAQRLHEAASVKVDVLRNMNRGEAVKRAKAEQEMDVVLLQLRADSVRPSGGNVDLSQVYIEYYVFAPTTGKVITSGNVYQQAYRTKGVIMAPPTSGQSPVYAELRLKQAAKDAAERILSALHISRPPELP